MSISKNELKQFIMTNQLLNLDLKEVEGKFRVDLGSCDSEAIKADQDYYPQIEQTIRDEAALMAPHYEVFYSLEKSVRSLISESLFATEGEGWWESIRVGEELRKNAVKAKQKEVDSGFTPRSTEWIDYCTFGELSEIIKQNWDLFGSIFTSVRAVERVMSSLNTLRGPIAHCSPLADDEALRLKLAVRDWFRLMD